MDFLKEPMDFKFFTDSGNLFHSRGPLHMIENCLTCIRANWGLKWCADLV